MFTIRSNGAPNSASLEAAAASARGVFACTFSTSEEYETALISARRAQGRYASLGDKWSGIIVAGSLLMVAGAVVLLA